MRYTSVSTLRIRPATRWYAITLVGLAIASCNPAIASAAISEPLLLFHFDEGTGASVHDARGREASVIGTPMWVKGVRNSGFAFNGQTYIRIHPDGKDSRLNGNMSISAWVMGRGSPLRISSGYRGFRSPYFQVVGDVVHLVTNSDDVPYALWNEHAHATSSVLEGIAERPLWTGQTDLNLAGWTYTKRTVAPAGGIEPKLQVVGNTAHYEFFGKAAGGIWQVFTASSTADGLWRQTQRTDESDVHVTYRVEQSDNIQVAHGRVYFAYPRLDQSGVWQLVSASYRVDGTDYQETAETKGGQGAWVPSIQVYGNRLYYLYATSPGPRREKISRAYDLYFASSNLAGGDWKVIRKIASAQWVPAGWGSFTISAGTVYFILQQQVDPETGWSAIFTGSMGIDGAQFTATQRSFEHGFAGPGHASIQLVGQRMYYVYDVLETERTSDQWRADNGWRDSAPQLDPRTYKWSHWTAEANADGTGWEARCRARGSDVEIPRVGYKGVQVIGAKAYYGGNVQQYSPIVAGFEVIATSGANLISKGDAFGIGLTESGFARAFINAGQDYLNRGEAPLDIAGAVADAALGSDTWHHLAMTHDGTRLRLYVDGDLRSEQLYSASPAQNGFPIVLGDGLQGVLDEVAVYDQVLTAQDVRDLYSKFRPH